MNTAVLHHAINASLAGTMTFPEVVGALAAEGVESYRADLVRREDIFYMPDGATHVEPMDFAPAPIATEFSALEVIAAIRAIQARQIKYKEFLDRITAAGTTSYAVFLNGRKAIYFGRKGDFHIEDFPGVHQ